jgi:Flp pilus assembly protein TadD
MNVRSMITSPSRAAFAVALAAILLIAPGCQRSLTAVRESGERAYKEGNYTLARGEFEEYLDRKPGNPAVTYMLGKSYLKLGMTAQARERLLVAHSMRLEDDEIFEGLCEGLFADKKFEELNRVLRQRTIDRGRMKDYLLLAEYSQKMGDDDEAQRALLTAARVDHGMSIQPQIALAKLYIKAGDNTRAIERLRAAYFIDPRNGEVEQLATSLGETLGPTFGKVPEER